MSETQPTSVTAAARRTPAGVPRRRRRWPWLVVALGTLGAGYAAVAVGTGGKTPSDTVISGVDIGGLSREEAIATLSDALAAKAAASVPVVFGDKTVQLDPKAAGLALDYEHSVKGLTGVTFNPVDLVAKIRGSVDREATRTIDDDVLRAALAKLAVEVDRRPTDAAISFADGELKIVPGIDGVDVDVAATGDAVAEAWLRAARVQGVTSAVEPEVTDDEVASVKEDVADKVLAGPITLEVDGKEFDVPVRPLTAAVSFPVTDGRPVAAYDTTKIVAAVRDAGREAGVLRPGKDARVVSSGGSFRVLPSQDGVDVDGPSAVAGVKAAIAAEDRSATVTSKVAPAAFTTAEAKETMPTGVISTFSTQFPYSPDRTHNIKLAARALNEVYVAPGEQFSLNGRLGQRTPEKGYRGAPVIYNGRLTKDYGGGISQVSTTLFNAVFFSGAQIDEFHPHSFYISRYPMGREATISWPNVDQKFTNTTKGGIVIRTAVDSNSITVTFYGKKTWDIEATLGPRVNITQPKTIHDDGPDCVPQSPGEGFDVTVGRIFKKAGKVVDTSYFTTHYIPEDLVICG